MKNVLTAVAAATFSTLLVSSSAFAFCFAEKAFEPNPNQNNSDAVRCVAGGDAGDNTVFFFTDIGEGNDDYVYLVSAVDAEEEAGGVLLDGTGSVVIGDEGPCNQSFSVQGDGEQGFSCTNSNGFVELIRVFVE